MVLVVGKEGALGEGVGGNCSKFLKIIYTPAVRSNILSKLIFASFVWYSDRTYHGLCVLIKDEGPPLPLQLKCRYQGQLGDVRQSVQHIVIYFYHFFSFLIILLLLLMFVGRANKPINILGYGFVPVCMLSHLQVLEWLICHIWPWKSAMTKTFGLYWRSSIDYWKFRL